MSALAAAYGCSWNTCHDAVAATADPVLDAEPEPAAVLGIDETRRGKAKYQTCPDTGTRVWVDRFDTGLVDITGHAGLLVQVNGRSAQPVTDWLAERDQAWLRRDHPCGDRHVDDLRQGRPRRAAAREAHRGPVSPGQTSQPDGRSGAPAHHLGQPRPQSRPGMAQPAPTAARGRNASPKPSAPAW